MTLAISYEDIVAAAGRIRGIAVRTPLLENLALNERLGGRVFIKPECLQHAGAFKFRGAYNRISQLTDAEKKRGVVAFSSGNHAQGVALAARMLGVKATIVMPQDAPEIKVRNTKGYGAIVRLFDRYSESREAIAAEISEKEGAIVVPSFNDPHIMAGQGTIGLEIAEDLKAIGVTPDQILTGCGGGGLASGLYTVLGREFPDAARYVVEPATYDDTKRSLESGERQHADISVKSICDALLSEAPGPLTFAVLQAFGVKGLTVSDREAADAVAYAAETLKLTTEPGGVVSLAALLEGRLETKGRTSVIVLSGGNIDPKLLSACLGGNAV